MILTLIKIACIIYGFCLGTDFTHKALQSRNKHLFIEGFVVLLLTALFSLAVF